MRDNGPWDDYGSRVISLISQKGGVGKTTSAVNLGAAFALTGHRVLVVGTDPQCGVAASLGFDRDRLRGGLAGLLAGSGKLADVIHESSLPGLHFVSPNAWSLEEERRYKASLASRPQVLSELLADVRGGYDTVLIDCPPGVGPETRAALRASDAYLVPIQAEELCRGSLTRLLSAVANLSLENGSPPVCMGMFLTMYDTRTRLGQLVSERVADEYGDALLETSVPRTVRLAEMAVHGKPTVIYDRMAAGSRAYFNLMDEIVLRHHARIAAAEVVETPRATAIAAAAGADAPLPAARPAGSSPMARLLAELGAAAPGNGKGRGEPERSDSPSFPRVAAPSADLWPDGGSADPDMVSLDELLAEEERRAHEGDDGEDYEDGDYWRAGNGSSLN